MFEKVTEKFSIFSLLLRLVASIRTTNVVLKEMAETQRLTLQYQLLQQGMSVEELKKTLEGKVEDTEHNGELVFTGENELVRWEMLSQKFIAKFNTFPPVDATAEWLEEQVDV